MSKQRKMERELQIISKEFIKPSSPTPRHLRRLQFSFLDQLQPNVFIHIIYFYHNKNPNPNNSTQWKKSLSEALSIFYPLAGRVNSPWCVDCNDEGMLFVEAQVNCQLSDFLPQHDLGKYALFMPPKLQTPLAASSQITTFNCGGFALSYSFFHRLGDGLSMITFLSIWGAITRGDTQVHKIAKSIPSFGSSSRFPPIEIPQIESDTGVAPSEQKIVTKVFVFDGRSISSIKERYSANCGRRVSRVEALVGFLCSRFIAATQTKNKRYRVLQAINLRSRMNPPLPDLSFGNYAYLEPVIEGNVDDEDQCWFGAVNRIADSTRNVKADYIKKFENKDEQFDCFGRIFDLFKNDEVISMIFSSVQKFPTYEPDFGWGKPVWATSGCLPMKNVFISSATKDGEGTQVYICLKEEDMAKLEQDTEFIRHVSAPTLNLNWNSRL